MTVEQLIRYLSNYNPLTPVYVEMSDFYGDITKIRYELDLEGEGPTLILSGD